MRDTGYGMNIFPFGEKYISQGQRPDKKDSPKK
jgi:hypothetical protein